MTRFTFYTQIWYDALDSTQRLLWRPGLYTDVAETPGTLHIDCWDAQDSCLDGSILYTEVSETLGTLHGGCWDAMDTTRMFQRLHSDWWDAHDSSKRLLRFSVGEALGMIHRGCCFLGVLIVLRKNRSPDGIQTNLKLVFYYCPLSNKKQCTGRRKWRFFWITLPFFNVDDKNTVIISEK